MRSYAVLCCLALSRSVRQLHSTWAHPQSDSPPSGPQQGAPLASVSATSAGSSERHASLQDSHRNRPRSYSGWRAVQCRLGRKACCQSTRRSVEPWGFSEPSGRLWPRGGSTRALGGGFPSIATNPGTLLACIQGIDMKDAQCRASYPNVSLSASGSVLARCHTSSRCAVLTRWPGRRTGLSGCSLGLSASQVNACDVGTLDILRQKSERAYASCARGYPPRWGRQSRFLHTCRRSAILTRCELSSGPAERVASPPAHHRRNPWDGEAERAAGARGENWVLTDPPACRTACRVSRRRWKARCSRPRSRGGRSQVSRTRSPEDGEPGVAATWGWSLPAV